MAWMLLLEAGCIGSFLAMDLFLFFVMFEITLVPMYFIISGWGYSNRVYAAMKFFIYTMAGSAFLFVGILSLVLLTGQRAPDLRLHRTGPPGAAADPGRTAAHLSRPRGGLRRQDSRFSRSIPGSPTPTPKRRPRAR